MAICDNGTLVLKQLDRTQMEKETLLKALKIVE